MGADAVHEDDVVKATAARGAPLVATPARWLATTGGVVGGGLALAWASLAILHSHRALSSFAGVGALGAALVAGLLWLTLRAEEVRLGRELRTARTGTAALRSAIIGRRRQGSSLTRFFSTHLGTAAVLLAQQERSDALDALARRSLLVEGGRLSRLRAAVASDVDRDSGRPAALDQSIRRLEAMPRIGNREADLYRVHILVKAVLERGDPEKAVAPMRALEGSGDPEERVYRAWLTAWFDLDDPGAQNEGALEIAPLSEGELRLALLLARAHGADRLVDKLGARLAAIAPPGQGV